MTIPYFNAKAIYDELRRKRQLMPIQHGKEDPCQCSLCQFDREQADQKKESQT